MHLIDHLRLPEPYTARPYGGPADHPAMRDVLEAYRLHLGDPERPSVAQLDVAYASFEDCDVTTDVAMVEAEAGRVVGYVRTHLADVPGSRDCVLLAPLEPAHLQRELFRALVAGQESHMARWAAAAPPGRPARYRAYAGHPGPDQPARGEAAWLEELGYVATEWEASLVRPHLDDVPERPLPPGVEVRPVAAGDLRPILEAHADAFVSEWDHRELTESDIVEVLDDPYRDESLWQVAWAGDVVVGQVKTFVNHDENRERGILRGYTEGISTHPAWRGRGVAGALLTRSLRQLRELGMQEAALGVDVNNVPAFRLYTGLGFVVQSYEVVYTQPYEPADGAAAPAPGAQA